MTDPIALRANGKYLADADIRKILGLGKVELPQLKIASLIGCSQKAVQHTVTTYHFETFQGRNARGNYQRKITQREDRYIERALK